MLLRALFLYIYIYISKSPSRTPFLPCDIFIQRFTLALLDTTIFPANAIQLKHAIDIFGLVLNMGNQNIGHVQLPVAHTNTTSQALIKHRRHVEDSLLQKGLDVTQTVALQFSKPADANTSDKRRLLQSCLAVASDPKACPWSAPSVIGPAPLVKVSDMIGYDADSRPGATARAEQRLA